MAKIYNYSNTWRLVIKRILLFSLIFLLGGAITQFAVATRNLRFVEETVHAEYLEEVIFNTALHQEGDQGLFLYRNETSREKVTDFFINLTGDRDTALPILQFSDRYDIPLSLAFSLAWAESRYNPRAVNQNSSSIDRGLFQLNSRSFPNLTENEYFNPWANAQHGLKYLRYCLDEGGNEIVGLAMYNAGRSRVTKQGAPLLTLEYISLILDYRRGLELRFKEHFSSYVIASAGNTRLDREGKNK